MVSDRIKHLRETKAMTQSDLAKELGITRSSVNAWEMGISVPSTQYIVELASIFKVSTDYLLGVDFRFSDFFWDTSLTAKLPIFVVLHKDFIRCSFASR